MTCLLMAAVALALLAAGCGRNSGQPSREMLVFWEQFRATNSAWLDPAPPALTCEFALQAKDYDAHQQTFPWREAGSLAIWCTPEKNLRVVHRERLGAKSWRTNEYRYVHGRGDWVRLKPGGGCRDLGLDLWLAGRTGAGWLSFLHLCAAWGLPPNAAVRTEGDSTVVLTVTNIATIPVSWRRELILTPAYGLSPAVFGSQTLVSPDIMEVTIDRGSLLPKRIVERNRGGTTDAEITILEPWLDVGGRKVPAKVRCRLSASKYDLSYEFAVEQGVWVLKEFTRDSESYSLCARASLASIEVGPLADDRFPRPEDLEIPKQSFTTLVPGERVVPVLTSDGLSLEAKLSLPANASGPVPVVFFLPGAGPFTFDRPLVYPDLTKLNEMMPPVKVYNYFDFYSRELSARGWGLFRMNKRGCGIVRDDEGHPREICHRSTFARATPSVLLEDYRKALEELRRQPGVDPNHIVLLGGSEGTRMASRLAAVAPDGIRAVAMMGYAGDNTHDTIVWQNTIGPWRNVARIFDENNDNRISRAEYDEVVRARGQIVADALPFTTLDRNRNGTVTPEEMNYRHKADEILAAVQQKNDDYLWQNLLQLSSAYLLEDWKTPPLYLELLKLQIPLALFHGEQDGACRVEAAREARNAFERAGRTNLTLRTYSKTDHDLNWARFLKDGKTPEAFSDVFQFIAGN